ncbi:hypothetical protein DLV40_23780 [Shigella flexneri]|nr:hypothetical protein [Shigella flexneri]
MSSLMQKLSTLWCLKGVECNLNIEGSKIDLKIVYNGEILFSQNSSHPHFKDNAIMAVNNLMDRIY